MSKPFAIVTGASSGIGLELAAICAQQGFDLLIAADQPEFTRPPTDFATSVQRRPWSKLSSPPSVVSTDSGRRRLAVP